MNIEESLLKLGLCSNNEGLYNKDNKIFLEIDENCFNIYYFTGKEEGKFISNKCKIKSLEDLECYINNSESYHTVQDKNKNDLQFFIGLSNWFKNSNV